MCQMCEFAAAMHEAQAGRRVLAADGDASGASSSPTEGVGQKGRRTLVKGGGVVWMDVAVGKFANRRPRRRRHADGSL